MLTYTDLILLPTFEERVEFLRTDGKPSELTFDALRFLNQTFYNSSFITYSNPRFISARPSQESKRTRR